MANLGVLPALLGAATCACRTSSTTPACSMRARLAGCELKRYPHADADGALRQLESQPDAAALLATDGVFSMDGDVAPLRELARVCARRSTRR